MIEEIIKVVGRWKEWDDQQAAKKRKLQEHLDEFGRDHGDGSSEAGAGVSNEDDENFEVHDDEEFPFACFICRENFTDPIITLCGHYFCSECALNRNKNVTTKCAVCTKQTFGVFNKARKLIKHINTMKGVPENNRRKTSSTNIAQKKGSWKVVE